MDETPKTMMQDPEMGEMLLAIFKAAFARSYGLTSSIETLRDNGEGMNQRKFVRHGAFIIHSSPTGYAECGPASDGKSRASLYDLWVVVPASQPVTRIRRGKLGEPVFHNEDGPVSAIKVTDAPGPWVQPFRETLSELLDAAHDYTETVKAHAEREQSARDRARQMELSLAASQFA